MEVQSFQLSILMDLYLLHPLSLGTTVYTPPPCYVRHFMLWAFSTSHKSQRELFNFCFNIYIFFYCHLSLTHLRWNTSRDWVLRQSRNKTIFLAPVWCVSHPHSDHRCGCQGTLGPRALRAWVGLGLAAQVCPTTPAVRQQGQPQASGTSLGNGPGWNVGLD